MKTANLLLSAICFFTICNLLPASSFAQGNLQFNQVINMSIAANACGYTVPSGKVFKLEAASNNSGAGCYLYMGSSCGASDYGMIYFTNAYYYSGYNASAVVL